VAETHLDVLLLEDDRDTRDSLRELLELGGYRVAAFAQARDALESLQRGSTPRLLLLDLHLLDEMSGWDFIAEHRRLQLAPIPVVIVSGLPKAEINGSLLGAVEVLRKPLDVERLEEVVARHCGPPRASPGWAGSRPRR
jgi:two-component system, chemotaxis family, chemotaxis protein CheY